MSDELEVLKVPKTLPAKGILVGWSLEHEEHKPQVGFTFGADTQKAARAYLEPILYTGTGHLMTVSPTGSGKSITSIIPTLLRHRGPAIVIDPKGEALSVTGRRRKKLKQKVVALDPFGLTGQKRAQGLNPLDLIDPASPHAVDDAASIASMIFERQAGAEESFWENRAHLVVTGLILHLCLSAAPKKRNLAEVRRLLSQPADAMKVLAQEMTSSTNGEVRQIATVLSSVEPQALASILAVAQTRFAFLRNPAVQAATARSDIKLADVTDSAALSIFLVVPPERLGTHAQLLRLWVGVLMSAVMRRRQKPPESTLFILDEAAQLGRFEQLSQAILLFSGIGLQTWTFWQDFSQLMQRYPAEWEALFNACKVQQRYGVANPRAARVAAEMSGFHDPLTLLTLDADEMMLATAGDDAVVAQRPNYLSDNPFKGHFDENPFLPLEEAEALQPRHPQRRYRRPSPLRDGGDDLKLVQPKSLSRKNPMKG